MNQIIAQENQAFGANSYPDFKTALIQSACSQCGLSESRTHIVVDRGNPMSRVLIIGEAPGANEDYQGKAFVGRAGRLLDQLMMEIGFDTNRDGLIVNVVKCRPPDNRAPSQEEVDACFPFLKKQIDLVRPKVILLLGATALRHVLRAKEKFTMSEEVGRFFNEGQFTGAKFMALYHPAFILRNMSMKPVMREHLARFQKYWRQTIGDTEETACWKK